MKVESKLYGNPAEPQTVKLSGRVINLEAGKWRHAIKFPSERKARHFYDSIGLGEHAGQMRAVVAPEGWE